MRQGDLVVRRSYGGDVLFRIETFYREYAILKGTEFRLLADSYVDDLVTVTEPEKFEARSRAGAKMRESMLWMDEQRKQQRQKAGASYGSRIRENTSYFDMPGKVLHLDGDQTYLHKSIAMYEQLGVPAEGYYVSESRMADLLYRLLPQSKPDIVVITGHDGLLKSRRGGDIYSLNSYKNSQNFVNAVRVTREYERNRDALKVIAGACQSHFEALLKAGANFASSPGRILIHALDPGYVAAKTAYTSIKDTVNMPDIFSRTVSGVEGMGGIESYGSYRIGVPKPIDLSKKQITPTA